MGAQRLPGGPGGRRHERGEQHTRARLGSSWLELGAEHALQLRWPSAWRVVWSQLDTTSDSGSRSSAARLTRRDGLEQAGALLDEGVDPLGQRERRRRSARASGTMRSYCSTATASIERLAVGEVLEDRALGDAGPLGDPLGRRLELPLVEQREQRVDERLPGALGPDRPAVARALGRGLHGPTIRRGELFLATSGLLQVGLLTG